GATIRRRRGRRGTRNSRDGKTSVEGAMKKKKRKFIQFVERLHSKSHTQRLAIIDDKMRRLRVEGGNKKKLKRLAVLRDYLAAAGQVAQKMPRRSVVPPADAFAGSTRIQLRA